MNKGKTSSLIIATLLLASTLLIFYMPKVNAPTVMHTASVSPATTTLPRVTYVFNVTNISNATEKITNVTIDFPSGFAVVTVQPPTDWTNDTGWPTITFSNTTDAAAIDINASKLFNITVDWPAVPPTAATIRLNCTSGSTPSINNPINLTVTFNPQFSATIAPSLVKGSTSYNFNITVVNTASTVGLGAINITYPNGWTFNSLVNYGGSRTWSIVHDASEKTFKLTGPNLLTGEYIWILVNMTTPSSTADPVNWTVKAWDISATFLGIHNLPVTVDAADPVVTISQPGSGVSYYTVSFGNKIWINGTVADDLNITKYGLTLTINVSGFERVVWQKSTDTSYNFAFANNTVIPDGPLAFKVTATDSVGHTGSAERATTIDNTAPQIVWVKILDQSGGELPYVSDTYWMGAGTTGIKVNASFYNPATPITGKIYLNATEYSFVNGSETSPDFDVSSSDYVVLKITLVDSAQPLPNNFTKTWEIKRDKVKPSTPTFTVQPICGGAIIRALNATDNVGVLSYKVYINGTPSTVTLTSLKASTLTAVGSHRTFSEILVLNLSGYAGKTANITIAAVDYGANEGTGVSSLIAVPAGTWHPVELYYGWNLVSLPLLPNSTSRAEIYSLILKQGAAGVTVTYGFDNVAKSWTMDPATMTDGNGYWIYMNAYDVLIVQGRKAPEPPALPTTYHLIKGWNLAGYTETTSMNASAYVESLETDSYYRWLYVWNAATQSWSMVDTNPASSGTLYPGQAFWIYLYKDQDLIPPTS